VKTVPRDYADDADDDSGDGGRHGKTLLFLIWYVVMALLTPFAWVAKKVNQWRRNRGEDGG
jgi:hypothetical protein